MDLNQTSNPRPQNLEAVLVGIEVLQLVFDLKGASPNLG